VVGHQLAEFWPEH
jgi:signal transduction histidine kinase